MSRIGFSDCVVVGGLFARTPRRRWRCTVIRIHGLRRLSSSLRRINLHLGCCDLKTHEKIWLFTNRESRLPVANIYLRPRVFGTIVALVILYIRLSLRLRRRHRILVLTAIIPFRYFFHDRWTPKKENKNISIHFKQK